VQIRRMTREPNEPKPLTLDEISAVGPSSRSDRIAAWLAARIEHTVFYMDAVQAELEEIDRVERMAVLRPQ